MRKAWEWLAKTKEWFSKARNLKKLASGMMCLATATTTASAILSSTVSWISNLFTILGGGLYSSFKNKETASSIDQDMMPQIDAAVSRLSLSQYPRRGVKLGSAEPSRAESFLRVLQEMEFVCDLQIMTIKDGQDEEEGRDKYATIEQWKRENSGNNNILLVYNEATQKWFIYGRRSDRGFINEEIQNGSQLGEILRSKNTQETKKAEKEILKEATRYLGRMMAISEVKEIRQQVYHVVDQLSKSTPDTQRYANINFGAQMLFSIIASMINIVANLEESEEEKSNPWSAKNVLNTFVLPLCIGAQYLIHSAYAAKKLHKMTTKTGELKETLDDVQKHLFFRRLELEVYKLSQMAIIVESENQQKKLNTIESMIIRLQEINAAQKEKQESLQGSYARFEEEIEKNKKELAEEVRLIQEEIDRLQKERLSPKKIEEKISLLEDKKEEQQTKFEKILYLLQRKQEEYLMKYEKLSLAIKARDNKILRMSKLTPGIRRKLIKLVDELEKLTEPVFSEQTSLEMSRIELKNILPNKPDNPIIGLRDQLVEGDGHCLYRAVSYYLGLGGDVRNLRQLVADRIEENKAQYLGFIDLPEDRTIEEYIDDIRNTNAWAGDLEIYVLMCVLNRPIVIIDSDGNIMNYNEITEFDEEIPIFVRYNGINHYDALILNGEREGSEILSYLKQVIREYSY
jgi:hypothetical protein